MTPAVIKFVGLDKATATAVEMHRRSPDETEGQIILRALTANASRVVDNVETPNIHLKVVNIGQGIELTEGETAYLFISKSDAIRNKISATAIVRSGGFEISGKVFRPERGSFVQRPMNYVQEQLEHRGADGKLVSLSGYRQWHVIRNGQMVTLDSLKQADKARRRRTNLRTLSADELDAMLASL